MIVLDAYAIVALIGDEPAAGDVEKLLRTGECALTVPNLAEAIDVSCRVHGLPLEEVRTVLDALVVGGPIGLLSPDHASAWRAAELRVSYYERRVRELSLSDCFLLAAASLAGAQLATSDPPLAEVAREEGIKVVALPDSSGVRP